MFQTQFDISFQGLRFKAWRSRFKLINTFVPFVFASCRCHYSVSLGIRFSPTEAIELVHFIAYWPLHHLAVYAMFW